MCFRLAIQRGWPRWASICSDGFKHSDSASQEFICMWKWRTWLTLPLDVCSFLAVICPVPVHLCFYIWLFALFVFLFLTVSNLPIVKYFVWCLAVYKVIYGKLVICWSWGTECRWNCCFVLSWFSFLDACVKMDCIDNL